MKYKCQSVNSIQHQILNWHHMGSTHHCFKHWLNNLEILYYFSRLLSPLPGHLISKMSYTRTRIVLKNTLHRNDLRVVQFFSEVAASDTDSVAIEQLAKHTRLNRKIISRIGPVASNRQKKYRSHTSYHWIWIYFIGNT